MHAIVILLMMSFALFSGVDRITPLAKRPVAPNFMRSDQSGRPLRLLANRGEVVLLDFWATTCGGCKVEIPWYLEFAKKYRSRGLRVIGVSMDEGGMKVVKPFLAAHGMSYPVVIGDDEMAKNFDVTELPKTLLIDQDGRIAVTHTGIVDKDAFEQELLSLLEERKRP